MNKVYLLIGGNVGNRLHYLQQAVELITAACGKPLHQSAVYETAAWGKTDQQAFLNQALEIETVLPAGSLMKTLLSLEEKMGRKRETKYGPRTIDMDILLFNDDILNTPRLIVPHPELPNRRFALIPLSEIAGDRMHPVYKKTIRQLLLECPDKLPVKKFSPQ